MGSVRFLFTYSKRLWSKVFLILNMKFISALPLLAMVSAQDNDSDGLERKFSHITAMLQTQVTTTHPSKTLYKMIQNYGCHCFPGMSKAAGGAGPAQDELDELCRTLSRCHKCIEMDHAAEVSVQWNSDFGKYRWNLENDNSITCGNNNEQHKEDLCMCDAKFAMDLGAYWTDAAYDYTKWNNKNNNLYTFDAEGTCVQTVNEPADDCCGDYPMRYPYPSATRDCCDVSGKTYGLTQDCCLDGSIVSMGSC